MGGARSRRRRAVQGVVLLCLVAAPAVIYLYRHRPNLYDGTRTDLLQASRELDIYHHDMEIMANEDQHGTDALRASINWLHQAAASDPGDLEEINAITVGLQRWEQSVRSGALPPQQLHLKYRSLEARVERLIKKHTRPAAPG